MSVIPYPAVSVIVPSYKVTEFITDALIALVNSLGAA
jgi:hypothetical protein